MGQVTIRMQPGPGAGYVQAKELLDHVRQNELGHRAIIHVDGTLWAITVSSDTESDDQLAYFYKPAIYLQCTP